MKAVLIAICIVLSACSLQPATQIVVRVNAEEGVRADLDVVHVVVNGGDGTTTGAPRVQRLDVRERPLRWPFTVVIAPIDRDSQRRYEVIVSAEGATSSAGAERPVIARVRAVSGFVPGETRVLNLLLEDACRSVSCNEDETCRAGACESAFIDPRMLPDLAAAPDTGLPTQDVGYDSSLDGGNDAGNLIDASDSGAAADASRTDGGSEPGILLVRASASAMGGGHTCVLRADGSVWCWGRNDQGQLGDGTRSARARPTRVIDLPPVEDLALGGRHTCARTDAGTVFCWGSNTDLQVGAGSATLDGVLTPVEVDRVVAATGIACGYDFSCAVLLDGSVSCWGSSLYGQLGVAGGSSLPPRRLDGLADIQAVAAGAYHACAATLEGAVYCWGRGPLGDGSDGDHPEPGPVVMPMRVTQLAASNNTTCALAGTEVWCWGDNAAHPTGVSLPTLALSDVTAVSIGAAGCAIGLDRQLRCWGGWVGDGTSTSRRTPALLAAPVDVLEVASNGANAACALASGGLWCWGQNLNGEVGDGTTVERPSPTLVSP